MVISRNVSRSNDGTHAEQSYFYICSSWCNKDARHWANLKKIIFNKTRTAVCSTGWLAGPPGWKSGPWPAAGGWSRSWRTDVERGHGQFGVEIGENMSGVREMVTNDSTHHLEAHLLSG